MKIKNYKGDFKRCPNLEHTYDDLNEMFFEGRLPRMYVGYASRMGKKKLKSYGYTCFRSDDMQPQWIAINKKIKGWWEVVMTTLIHECAHVACPNRKGKSNDHGKKFKKEMKRLMDAGAFDSLL